MTKPFPHGVVHDAASVTDVVLRALSQTPDPRLRTLLEGLVCHLHDYLRETRLTEAEFEVALDFIVRLGQASGREKNEVILASDLLGLSTLAMMINNNEASGTDAALLGPFWRANAPEYPDGTSIVAPGQAGERLEVSGHVRAADGSPIEGAIVDVWQASPKGLYENQDPEQPDHHLRGRLRTGGDGSFHFTTAKPAGYPVPTDGPCGEMLRAQQRHPYRPAHIHFMISHEGFRTLITQVFDNADAVIESDVVFGVTPALSGDFRRQPDGRHTLHYDFVLQRGEKRIPRPPLP